MVYKNNIPQPGDSPATDSQADLLENFAQLNTQFAIDHIAFNAGAGNGEHKFVTLNDVQADPGPVEVFPKGSIYTKELGLAPDRYTNLFFKSDPENAVLASQFPLNAIKAWCRFTGTAASPIAPTDGFNVTNITHAGLGQYTVNFTNNLQNSNYAVFSMTSGASLQIVSTAVSNTVVRTGSLAQQTIVTVLVIGN